MKRIFFIISTLFLFSSLFAQESAGYFVKEKKEILALKNELNKFYNLKEEEYQKRKQELDSILAKIQDEKNQIKDLYEKNQAILKDIKGEVATKTSKIYNSMKPKVAATIFDNMIEEGKIEDVFDIILKLKENKVTLILKFLSVKNASLITEKLKNFQIENSTKDNNG